MHLFVLDRAPQAFDEDVVHETAAPVLSQAESSEIFYAGSDPGTRQRDDARCAMKF
jgi:hypothetical protein